MSERAPLTGTLRALRVGRPRRAPSAALRNFVRNPIAVISVVAIVIIVVLVVFAHVFAPIDPTVIDLKNIDAAPSAAHWLGTDSGGRDIWSRLLHGGQLTLVGALVVIVVADVVGIVGGLLAGYFGGWIDQVGSWLSSLLLALPALIVLLALRTSLGDSILLIMAFFGVFISPLLFQVVRTAVRGVLQEPFVDAARVSGLSDGRIIFSHVLSAVRAPLVIQIMLIAGIAIGVQSALDFLGVSGSVTTWGGMLSEAFPRIGLNPLPALWPALVLGVITASLLLVGSGIRDAIDPRGVEPRRRKRVAAGDRATEPKQYKPSMSPDAPLLSVSDLTVRYPGRDGEWLVAVDRADLTVARGEVVGLVGESGSGKTQIAFSILGLLPQTASVPAGSIRFNRAELVGLSGRGLSRVRSGGIAYVPQEPISNLDPNFTVGYQLSEPLRVLKGLRRRAARTRALELLNAVQIRDPELVMQRYPHEISGGMAQRVLIAIALALDPELLIADEPTTALDVTVQSEVLTILRGLQESRGMSILLVTHDLGVAAGMCDRVTVLRRGVVVEDGDVAQIFGDPQHDYTRTLLSSRLDERPARGAVGTAPAEAAR